MKPKFFSSISLAALLASGAAPALAQPEAEQTQTQKSQASDQKQEHAITEIGAVTGAADAKKFVGREVELRNLQVTQVSGEKTFYVCGTEGEYDAESRCTSDEVLVLLKEESAPSSGQVEGRVDVDAGDRLVIESGRIGSYAQERGELIDLDIGEEELAMLSEAEYFIVADRLDMKREEGASERAQQGQPTQQQAQQGRQQAQQQQTKQQESEQTQAAGQQQSANADQQKGTAECCQPAGDQLGLPAGGYFCETLLRNAFSEHFFI